LTRRKAQLAPVEMQTIEKHIQHQTQQMYCQSKAQAFW